MYRKLIELWNQTKIRQCINLLNRLDRLKILIVIAINICLSFLDLLGVALIGIIGAITVAGIGTKSPGNRVRLITDWLNISDHTLQSQALILGLLATFVLVSRTMLSILTMRKTLFYLSRRSAVISGDLVTKLFSQPLLFLQSRSSQDTLYSVTTGVTALTVGVLGTLVTLVSDLFLIIVMTFGLLIVDPLLGIITFLIFIVIGISIFKLSGKKALQLGTDQAKLNISSSSWILEALNSYREIFVRHRRHYYSKEISEIRLKLSNSEAETAFLPYVSKYVFEIAIVLGGIIASGYQFINSDSSHAVSTLLFFFAAGSRVAPAILRIQYGLLGVKGALGYGKPTLNLISSIEFNQVILQDSIDFNLEYVDFKPNIKLSKISMMYPKVSNFAIKDINLEIDSGSIVAIVGPSGAGKTTLVDVILGLYDPSNGEVKISGLDPKVAITRWPGAISYVPQNIQIKNGTIRENVAMGYPQDFSRDPLINEALKLAQLDDFVAHLPNGLDSYVGERGVNMSGGQRQRLGIARALFTKPKMLVLDEATNSLDGDTESEVTSAIMGLRSKVTVILIAHRLSTVKNVDQIVYLKNGKILAKGNFNQVCMAVPDFQKNFRLMDQL